jgi:hypothetical protein
MTKDFERKHATQLLTHYLTMLMRAAGLPVDHDTGAEIQSIVDLIIDAAVAEARYDERTDSD